MKRIVIVGLMVGMFASGCEYYQQQPEIYGNRSSENPTAESDEGDIVANDPVVIPDSESKAADPTTSSPCLSDGAAAGSTLTTSAAMTPCLGAGAAPSVPVSPSCIPGDPAIACDDRPAGTLVDDGCGGSIDCDQFRGGASPPIATSCPEPAVYEAPGVCRIPAGTPEKCVAELGDGSFYCLYGTTAYCRDLFGRTMSCSESESCQAHPRRTGIAVCSIGNNVLCRDASNAVTDCFVPVSATSPRRNKK